MKRIVVLLLIAITVLSLGACGKRNQSEVDTVEKIRAEYQAYDWNGTDREKVTEMAQKLKTRIGKLAAAEQEKLKDVMEKLEAVLKGGENKMRDALIGGEAEEIQPRSEQEEGRRMPRKGKAPFPRGKNGKLCPHCRPNGDAKKNVA